MNRTWAFGDVHGSYKALLQIFEKAPIQRGDTIISLGDIADGWSQTYECVQLLIEMQEDYNMVFIKGNHDEWFNVYLKTGVHPVNGMHGSRVSIKSYEIEDRITNEDHHKFFRTQHKYYVDEKNRLFVHGGFNRHYLINEQQDDYIYWWDRDLWFQALSVKDIGKTLKTKNNFSEIFIGHTTTMNWGTDKPMNAGAIWNLDTGAGFKGKLTIIDVDTKEYWQSDEVSGLYFDEKGRDL